MPHMCTLMTELEDTVKEIERSHNIKLEHDEIEKLKRPLCSQICNGYCKKKYVG